MASKKGLSEAEKRTRMSEIFLSGDFFTFKEIEKIATQQKKIVLQSVKEILQSLVDDGLVSSDKIGTSLYYWSFPSDAKRSRQTKMEELAKELAVLQERHDEVNKQIQESMANRQDDDERAMLLKSLQEKEETKRLKAQELNCYKDSDPRLLENKARTVELYKEAAICHTDNIWSLQGYLVREYAISRDDLNAQFGIDEEELDSRI